MNISDSVKSYVSIYKDFIPKEIRENAVNNLKKSEWSLHSYYDPLNGELRTNLYDLSISYDGIEEKQLIQDSFWHAIHRYLKEDHSEVNSWYSGWSGYSELRFNKYDVDTAMDIHCDHIQSMFDGQIKGIPTLTLLGVLNDDYSGGDFVMWGDEVIDLPAGSVIVFPSNFLYPHHVTPITSGVRYSCVSWVW